MSNEELKDQEQLDGAESAAEAVAEAQATELTLEEQLEAARAEASKHLDGYLRAQAEVANARKRFEKQQALARTNAMADVVAKLLPVLDDFGRAVDNVPEAVAADGWYSGIELVHRKLNGILDNFNVKPIEAVGQMFDPNFHEAISQEPSDEYESGVVTRELLKGYQIGDRIIRPALVYVAE
ncbi:MAG: nucleotide exchange factor GrpE [Anaerolineales bacterium]|nr:nucleotide exchange factor GrpE [Anaerolineales bacterium]